MIKGIVQETTTNDWGFTSYKISGHKYGSEVKGAALAKVGDLVEFDNFDKPSKDGSRSFPTIRKGTFKVLPAEQATPAQQAAAAAPPAKDTYWKDKEEADKARQPVINYYASLERAIQAVALYAAQGALPVPTKAADKLAALQGAIDLETARFFKNANNALAVIAAGPVEVPVAPKAAKKKAAAVVEEADEAAEAADSDEGEAEWQ